MTLRIVLCLILWLLPQLSYAKETYSISIVPFMPPETTWRLYSPLAEYLSKGTGKQFKLSLVHDHKTLVNKLCNREVDFVFTGVVPFIEAQRRCQAKPIAIALDKSGKFYYDSVIFASDPNLKTLESLSNKRFGYVWGATTAHVVPFKILKDAGVIVIPVKYKRHEDIVKDVLLGKIDAGGVKGSVLEKFSGQKYHVIMRYDKVPGFLLCTHKDVDKEIIMAVVGALTKLKPLTNQKDRSITSDWGEEARYGFKLPDKAYIDELKRLELWTAEILGQSEK